MRLARPMVAAATLAASVLGVPGVARASWSVGPAPTLLAHGCNATSVSGDAAVSSDGVVRAFLRPQCAADPRISFAQATGHGLSPYAGRVLAVADDAGSTWVLYAASDGLRLGRRAPGGTFAASLRLSTVAPLSGDLVASGGKWWAVWAERVSASGLSALFQAKTLGTAVSRQRITFLARVDDRPSLARLASGTAVMAWHRYDPSTRRVDIVRGSSADGTWTVSAVTTNGVSRDPVVTATGPYLLLAWAQSGRVVYADTTSGAWRLRTMATAGRDPRLVASGGRVFVSWVSSAGHVILAERTGDLWVEQDVTPVVSARQAVLAVTGFTANATVIAWEPSRTYSRSQTRPSVETFRYLGAWIDLFDLSLDPAASVATMQANGVRTLYFETARYNSGFDVSSAAGPWLEAAHGAGLRAVAWYFPAYSEYFDRDVARTVAAARFVSAGGQRFDAVAVDIEFRGATSSPSEFNTGVTEHLRRVRAALGPAYPVGAIVPAPLGMALNPSGWTGFPWPAIGRFADVVLPMSYWSFRTDCPSKPQHCPYDYTRGNVSAVRRTTGLPVHVVGGIGDDVTAAEVSDFVRAAKDGGVLGGSLYDFATTDPSYWPHLSTLSP